MRKITIHQGSSVIEVFDDDNSELASYCEDLSKLFDSGNVSLLETSQATVILRPSRINGIIVENFQDDTKDQDDKEADKEKNEDIIMDVD